MIRYKVEAEFEAEDVGTVLEGLAYFLERLRRSSASADVDTYDSRTESPFADSVFNQKPKRRAAADAPTVAPDAEWATTDDSVPDSGASRLDKATEAQLAEGADLWMGVLMQWQSGFMDPDAEQPDRLKILSNAVMEGGGSMFACLHHYRGLTRMVRSFLATTPKKTARRIAENVAQVSSAAGIPVISDHLEFTKEYMGREYRNEQFTG